MNWVDEVSVKQKRKINSIFQGLRIFAGFENSAGNAKPPGFGFWDLILHRDSIAKLEKISGEKRPREALEAAKTGHSVNQNAIAQRKILDCMHLQKN